MSTAFHPQTDGQTEQTNRILEQYLRCYVDYQQTNWVQLLPIAQFAFNSAFNETTQTTLFEANYGYIPSAYYEPIKYESIAPSAEKSADSIKQLHRQMNLDIKFINKRIAAYYNKRHRMEPDLKKGEKVYLLRKNITTQRPSTKLDFKKLGPYEIEERTSPVNYRLKLPEGMRIHPVFHIALLKPAPEGISVDTTTTLENEAEEYRIDRILDSKLINGQIKYLVRWQDYSPEEDSWEPTENFADRKMLIDFHRRNPTLPAPPNLTRDQGRKSQR